MQLEQLASVWRESPLLSTYAFHAAVLVVKMGSMSLITMLNRVTKKASPNAEDAPLHGSKFKVTIADPDVERVRRAHQNDVENIPPFLVVSFLYVLTTPEASTALLLFRTFTAARLVYSVSYLRPVQPVRTLAYVAGLLVTAVMSARVLTHFW